MNNEIANKVFEMLEQIAEQLGVAAEKLYPILLKQARIDAYGNILLLILFFVLTAGLWYVTYQLIKDKGFHEDNEVQVGISIITGVAGFWFFIDFVMSIGEIQTSILTPLLNPDWYIINELLANLIK